MISRRDFLKTATLAGGAVVLNIHKVRGRSLWTDYFGLNEFIENHPDAVFILRTTVDVKTDAEGIKAAGYQLGKTLFVLKPSPTNGYAITTNAAIKPNITSWSWDVQPIEQTMGIQTDPYFVEGIINSLQDLSVDVGNIHICDGNYFGNQAKDGKWYSDLAQRTGVKLEDLSAGVWKISASDIVWIDVPNGVWFNRIPYLWPVNSPGSCFINIAKFKSHSMGMTLCSKNQQGTIARPYIAHCTTWGSNMGDNGVGFVDQSHIVPNAFATIKANYDRHKAAGIPRWDLPGAGSGGLWQETWASRCLDNNSVAHASINIIEGVYGREGPFVSGPPDNNGYGKDIMTNVVIFGKNALHVDIIGTYLAGHEPGNFGLFHMALERGLSKYLNPRDIPLYEWKLDGTATVTPLDSFLRTPTRTLYLQKAGEAQYHLVNEPYDYSGTSIVSTTKPDMPDAFAITQNFPNPFNPSTSIQFYIPKSGNVQLEIFDIRGDVVDVLVNAYMLAGDHVKVWNSNRRASGTYFYRLSFGGMSKTKSMMLLK